VSQVVSAHDQLGLLASLIGVWEGTGEGSWNAGPRFRYRERLTFTHGGKPLLAYSQQTWSLDDGRALHGEQGYWRSSPGGGVELVLAHGIGVVEIELGHWSGSRLSLRSAELALAPTAKPVTGLERVFTLDGDTLHYTLAMSVGGGAARSHLTAKLLRTST
jgi:hypothetical protein